MSAESDRLQDALADAIRLQRVAEDQRDAIRGLLSKFIQDCFTAALVEAGKDEAVLRLRDEVRYWKIEAETDHSRWLRTLEENDQLRAKVAKLEAAIISGGAIVPDAQPQEGDQP